MTSFADLGIVSPPLIEALDSRNIREPSEIQTLVIPKLLAEAEEGGSSPNLLFCSPTGTGKTLAYLLPLLQRETEKPPAIRILVLAPTYELCSQIKSELDFLMGFYKNPPFANLHTPLLIGSVPLARQIESLKKNRTLTAVGNPARVLQLVKMKKFSLKSLDYLVLDEGDRLMAEELYPESSELCRLAGGCRVITCSATFSAKNRESVFSLAGGGWAVAEESSSAVLRKNIEHWAFFSEDRKKIPLLRSFITAAKPGKALVFSSRAGQVGNIVSQLQYHHLAAGGISGDMDKRARKGSLDSFRKGELSVLVASDLACRGLDIPGISHIIALDVPDSAEAYLHRSGRTGRAGKRGIMVSIGNETEMRRLSRIEKNLGIVVNPKELYGGRIIKAGD
jgi:superfamily II DNA/RNA helicase